MSLIGKEVWLSLGCGYAVSFEVFAIPCSPTLLCRDLPLARARGESSTNYTRSLARCPNQSNLFPRTTHRNRTIRLSHSTRSTRPGRHKGQIITIPARKAFNFAIGTLWLLLVAWRIRKY